MGQLDLAISYPSGLGLTVLLLLLEVCFSELDVLSPCLQPAVSVSKSLREKATFGRAHRFVARSLS